MDTDHDREIRDRLRRIETRLTRYMQSQGFDTQAQKPTWSNGSVHIPSRRCALGECVDLIPASWPADDPVEVFCKGDHVATIFAGDPSHVRQV